MNNYNTINKRQVKKYASYILEKSLGFVAVTKITPIKVLIHMLIAAAVRCCSIEQVCKQHKKSPSGKTVRTHISKQLENIEDVEVRINRSFRMQIPKSLYRKPLKIAIDYVEISYHGEADDPDNVRRSKPKEGTSHFHTYATAYIIEKGQRYTIAITYVRVSDSSLDVLKRLNKRLNELSIRVELYLVDRGFYSVEVIKWLIRYNKCFIMPVIARGKKAKEGQEATCTQKLKTSKVSRWDSYTMKNAKKNKVTFEIAICCSNYNGKRNKHGRRTFLFATYGVRYHSLNWIRETYRTRFGIETSHRQMREVRIKTTTTNTAVRYLYIGIAFILRNIWVWLHWEIFAKIRRGPRGRKMKLELFSLELMKSWLRDAIAYIYSLFEQISIERPLPPEMLGFS